MIVIMKRLSILFILFHGRHVGGIVDNSTPSPLVCGFLTATYKRRWKSRRDNRVTSLLPFRIASLLALNIKNEIDSSQKVDAVSSGSANHSVFDDEFTSAMDRLGFPSKTKRKIQETLEDNGLVQIEYGNKSTEDGELANTIDSDMLLLLAGDFVERPEAFATLLREDFGLNSLMAHQTRAIVMDIINHDRKRRRKRGQQKDNQAQKKTNSDRPSIPSTQPLDNPTNKETDNSVAVSNKKQEISILSEDRQSKAPIDGIIEGKWRHNAYRKVVVDERAKRRRAKVGSASSSPSNSKSGSSKPVDSYDYGLPKDYQKRYPKLGSELEEFLLFMTRPSPYAQEDPIREATAKVYMRHAKLFLGWYLSHYSQLKKQDYQNGNRDGETGDVSSADRSALKYDDRTVSMFEIVPNKEKDSATPLIDFILWLRTARDVSVSYESNMLRGLIKLLKYRFARESQTDAYADGGKVTFDDIPIIRELRKIHRSANKRQQKAPRSSNEERKWLTWPEYLSVVASTKQELESLIRDYNVQNPGEGPSKDGPPYSRKEIGIAAAYQRYLILAILANVPDRQRTIRELELGRTLVKLDESTCWAIRHGPEDYKTGKSYGERPPMHLSAELTPAIDDFVANWRRCLEPSTDFLFVQGRGGKPMTADSVYRRVCETCFKYSGKRTNPHLIRDSKYLLVSFLSSQWYYVMMSSTKPIL